MSQVITEELHFLAVSLGCGLMMAAGYEILRLIRWFFHHTTVWIGLEDLLFWTICAVLIFMMVMEENSGMIRWYVLAGCASGACGYQFMIHPIITWVLSGIWYAVQRMFFGKEKKTVDKCKIIR